MGNVKFSKGGVAIFSTRPISSDRSSGGRGFEVRPISSKPMDFSELVATLRIEKCLAMLMRCKARIVGLDRQARFTMPTDFFDAVNVCTEKTWKMFYCSADHLRFAPETIWLAFFYKELEVIAGKLELNLAELGEDVLALPETRVLVDTIFATAVSVPFDKRGRVTVPEGLRQLTDLRSRCWIDSDTWGISIEDLQKRTQRIKQSASNLRSKLLAP